MVYPHFSQALSEEGAEGRRSRGAEGKEIVQYLTSAPLLPCSPAQAQALRDVVRNPGSSGRYHQDFRKD